MTCAVSQTRPMAVNNKFKKSNMPSKAGMKMSTRVPRKVMMWGGTAGDSNTVLTDKEWNAPTVHSKSDQTIINGRKAWLRSTVNWTGESTQ